MFWYRLWILSLGKSKALSNFFKVLVNHFTEAFTPLVYLFARLWIGPDQTLSDQLDLSTVVTLPTDSPSAYTIYSYHYSVPF